MSNYVVTISREYGSGGRIIGKNLASRLGISFYDKEMLNLLAEESGFSKAIIEEWTEKKTSSFLYELYTATQEKPISDQIFLAKTKIVQDLAQKESCVIVGNCADYTLQDMDRCLRVFIYASLEERAYRAEKEYKIQARDVAGFIKQTDKKRGSYYSHYTMNKWGDRHNYDISVDSGLGIDVVTDMLVSLVHAMYERE